MGDRLTRRDFVRHAASSGMSAALFGRASSAEAGDSPVLASLDGSLLQDDRSLSAATADPGGVVHRRPLAVLMPATVQDVVRAVEYAGTRRLPVVMRGRGCSRYGQSLVERGIVIRSETLDRVSAPAGHTIEAQTGAALEEVVRTALDAGFALPVMTGCTKLSLGGFLSVGGETRGSHRHGVFVDQVAELEVVTGDGKRVTCSESREPELFHMSLAGLGQCAIVTRAKLRVVPAPEAAVTRTLSYDTMDAFLHDQHRLVAAQNAFDHMTGYLHADGQGSWSYSLHVARLGARGAELDLGRFGLSAPRVGEARRLPYRDYAFNRNIEPAPSQTPAGRVVGGPALTVFAPASSVKELLSGLLRSRDDTGGISRIACTLYNRAPFRRPLLSLPDEDQFYAIWLLRIAYAESGPGLQRQLEANARFLDRALALGARRYPPYGMRATPADWKRHYGEPTYLRFAAAKQNYDPQRLLTPGPEIFA